MKQISVFFLSIFILLSFSACGNEDESSSGTKVETASVSNESESKGESVNEPKNEKDSNNPNNPDSKNTSKNNLKDNSKSERPKYKLSIDTSGYEEVVSGKKYTFEGIMDINLEDFPRQTDKAYSKETMRNRIKKLMGNNIRLQKLELSDEYSKQLTYPTWNIVYEMGENEDTVLCVDIYFQTDTGEHRLHTRTNLDYAAGYRDGLQDYHKRIQALFKSITLIEK